MTNKQNKGKSNYRGNKNKGRGKKFYPNKPTQSQIMKDKGVKMKFADGKEREFKFDLNALVALQEKLGDVQLAFEGLQGRDFGVIRTLLWALLVTEEGEDFTEMQAGSLIDIQSIGELAERMEESLLASTPVSDEDTEPVEGKEGN